MRKIFKNRHIIVLLLVALIGATCLAACGGDEVTTTVTYYVNGSVHGTASVTTGMTSSGVADPAVDGFTFGGWFTDEACTTPFDFTAYAADEGRADIFVYAKMVASSEPAQVNTITYYVQGSVYDTVTVTGNVASKTVADPSVDGYTFGGWYTDKSYSATFDLPAYVNSAERADISVYARMIAEDGDDPAPVKVTVNFDVNGGEGSYPAQEYESGDRLADLPTPERENHTFAGWQTADGTVYEDGSVVPASDLELIAQWTPDPSTVTLTFNGETIGTIELTQGKDYVIDPIPGYTLIDWKLAGTPVTGADGASLSPWQHVGGEYTLTATANATVYQVTYDLGGGENAFSNPDSYSIEDMDGDLEGAIELADPTFASDFIEAKAASDGSIAVKSNGKQFLGWFTEPEFTNQVTSLTIALGDVTLYAKWGDDVVVTRNVPYLRVDSSNRPADDGAFLLMGVYPQDYVSSPAITGTDGNYSTDADGNLYQAVGGTRYYRVEPICWRIVSESGGLSYLLAEDVLYGGTFGTSTSYASSRVRTWLNNDFLNAAFSQQQRDLISTTTVDGARDKVFVPSKAELTSLFSTARKATDYAQTSGMRNESNGYAYWWTRTAHSSAGNMTVVTQANGEMPCAPTKSNIGIVPALNIRLG